MATKLAPFSRLSTATSSGYFSSAPRPLLPARATNEGVVKFNQVGKPVETTSVRHCLPELAKHVAGSDPGNIKKLGNTKSGDAAFVGSQEVNGPFHSGRGSQYCSHDFQKLLKNHRILSSMSRKGDYWDNAVAESFFGSL